MRRVCRIAGGVAASVIAGRAVMTTLPEPARVLETAELIADADAVTEAIERMAADINAVFADKSPVVFGVMIGGVVPLVRLMRRFRFPHTVNYLHATRYRGATTGGDLVWRVAPPADLHGRDVLIIDDILDEGITLRAIVDEINDRNAGTVHTAVLVRKRLKPATTVPLVADFVGLEVPDRYVFGCGMDYRGFHRNLDAIYALAAP
jgi:hypoxanthine phosphoribosyltransferase